MDVSSTEEHDVTPEAVQATSASENEVENMESNDVNAVSTEEDVLVPDMTVEATNCKLAYLLGPLKH